MPLIRKSVQVYDIEISQTFLEISPKISQKFFVIFL